MAEMTTPRKPLWVPDFREMSSVVIFQAIITSSASSPCRGSLKICVTPLGLLDTRGQATSILHAVYSAKREHNS
jgi:hypothetical protein